MSKVKNPHETIAMTSMKIKTSMLFLWIPLLLRGYLKTSHPQQRVEFSDYSGRLSSCSLLKWPVWGYTSVSLEKLLNIPSVFQNVERICPIFLFIVQITLW